jgi:hypothetical protein
MKPPAPAPLIAQENGGYLAAAHTWISATANMRCSGRSQPKRRNIASGLSRAEHPHPESHTGKGRGSFPPRGPGPAGAPAD